MLCECKRMQNTEISWHSKSSKLSLYVPNPAQPKLNASFTTHNAKDKHNYNTKSATNNLLEIYFFNKNKYVLEKLY